MIENMVGISMVLIWLHCMQEHDYQWSMEPPGVSCKFTKTEVDMRWAMLFRTQVSQNLRSEKELISAFIPNDPKRNSVSVRQLGWVAQAS